MERPQYLGIKEEFFMAKSKITGISAVIAVLTFSIIFLILGCATGGEPKTRTRSASNNAAALVFEPDPEGLDRRVSIENGEFVVNGKRLWISGANTPWNKWGDFGGNENWNKYDDSWWNNEFSKIRKGGVNATRVWINCDNGNKAIIIDANGMVSGASDQHWADLDLLFETARRNRIYIMATLLSFDHFKDENSQKASWRTMITSKPAVNSFAENYVIPFVERYGDNPWLWSIDIMNEPDWLFEHQKIAWNDISYFFAVQAAAIHENSKVLVTVGMANIKWNADGFGGFQGNKVSDKFLQELYPNENAYMDFWSPHYYDWVGEWYGVPHYLTPSGVRGGNKNTGWLGGFGLDASKPSVLGECSANGTGKNVNGVKNNTIVTDYVSALEKGWQGLLPWTSNGVDSNGDFRNMQPGAKKMIEDYRDLIFPWD